MQPNDFEETVKGVEMLVNVTCTQWDLLLSKYGDTQTQG